MLIAAVILLLIAVAALAFAIFGKWIDDYNGRPWRTPNKILYWFGGIAALVATAFFLGTVFYTQPIGQAKVVLNLGGSIAQTDTTTGLGTKSPLQEVKTWDLVSQELLYAGGKEGAPDYTGGQVNGQEVTSSVAGGAQVNFDLVVSYNLDGEHITDLYSTYRSQERFTRQVIETQVLAAARDIPTEYSPVQFRGEKRGEATKRITDALNKTLAKHGVTVTLVTIQAISFTEDVEASIKAVEVAQQKEAQAAAELRATEVSSQAKVVEAEAEAEAEIAAANGEAEANRLLAASLTPEVLESKRLDTLKAVGDKGNLVVVPEGSTPFVQVTPKQ